MTNLSDYVTESEAAKMLDLTPAKGVVWRHLADHAPHIKQEKLFGVTAVRRADLEAWCRNGRKQVVDVATLRKRRRMLRQLQKRMANR